ncbi:MAG: hypothetical protein KDA51_07370, partial [Planctomycetales bacterium]|nr:hypothetical protein [Planctomycetales bacterium]
LSAGAATNFVGASADWIFTPSSNVTVSLPNANIQGNIAILPTSGGVINLASTLEVAGNLVLGGNGSFTTSSDVTVHGFLQTVGSGLTTLIGRDLVYASSGTSTITQPITVSRSLGVSTGTLCIDTTVNAHSTMTGTISALYVAPSATLQLLEGSMLNLGQGSSHAYGRVDGTLLTTSIASTRPILQHGSTGYFSMDFDAGNGTIDVDGLALYRLGGLGIDLRGGATIARFDRVTLNSWNSATTAIYLDNATILPASRTLNSWGIYQSTGVSIQYNAGVEELFVTKASSPGAGFGPSQEVDPNSVLHWEGFGPSVVSANPVTHAVNQSRSLTHQAVFDLPIHASTDESSAPVFGSVTGRRSDGTYSLPTTSSLQHAGAMDGFYPNEVVDFVLSRQLRGADGQPNETPTMVRARVGAMAGPT